MKKTSDPERFDSRKAIINKEKTFERKSSKYRNPVDDEEQEDEPFFPWEELEEEDEGSNL